MRDGILPVSSSGLETKFIPPSCFDGWKAAISKPELSEEDAASFKDINHYEVWRNGRRLGTCHDFDAAVRLYYSGIDPQGAGTPGLEEKRSRSK